MIMPERKRRKINTEHPDCAKYTAEFHAIWDPYFALEDEEKAKYPEWNGQDHPAYVVLRPAHKKCCEETKALRKKYAHLFVVVEDQ